MVAAPTGQLTIDSAGEVSLPKYPLPIEPRSPLAPASGALAHLTVPPASRQHQWFKAAPRSSMPRSHAHERAPQGRRWQMHVRGELLANGGAYRQQAERLERYQLERD